MSAASRRRSQWANGFKHLARLGRPIYRRRKAVSTGEAIQRERARAAAEQARKKKTK